MNLVKIKYRSILTDHLKNLLVLATSSMNPNIELLVNGKDMVAVAYPGFSLKACKSKTDLFMRVCVPNANPLHYYAFQVPRMTDRWH